MLMASKAIRQEEGRKGNQEWRKLLVSVCRRDHIDKNSNDSIEKLSEPINELSKIHKYETSMLCADNKPSKKELEQIIPFTTDKTKQTLGINLINECLPNVF